MRAVVGIALAVAVVAGGGAACTKAERIDMIENFHEFLAERCACRPPGTFEKGCRVSNDHFILVQAGATRSLEKPYAGRVQVFDNDRKALFAADFASHRDRPGWWDCGAPSCAKLWSICAAGASEAPRPPGAAPLLQKP
jgi:hypothetical protein